MEMGLGQVLNFKISGYVKVFCSTAVLMTSYPERIIPYLEIFNLNLINN